MQPHHPPSSPKPIPQAPERRIQSPPERVQFRLRVKQRPELATYREGTATLRWPRTALWDDFSPSRQYYGGSSFDPSSNAVHQTDTARRTKGKDRPVEHGLSPAIFRSRDTEQAEGPRSEGTPLHRRSRASHIECSREQPLTSGSHATARVTLKCGHAARLSDSQYCSDLTPEYRIPAIYSSHALTSCSYPAPRGRVAARHGR